MNQQLKAMMVPRNFTIRETMEAITEGATGTAFIVDDKNRLLGLVTDGDIRAAVLKGSNLDVSIQMIMNTTPSTLTPGFSSPEVYRLMVERHFLCMPVLDEERHVIDFVYLPTLASRFRDIRTDLWNISPELGCVLVIGGAGYIGSILVRKLLDTGYQVRVFDLLLYGNESLQDLSDHPNYEFVYGDTRNVEAVVEALQSVKAVVHLGEIVGDPACQLNPDFTIQVNYSATRMIAEVCRNFGIKRFVFASSCSVYGTGQEILTEESSLSPVSLYAQCKIEAERALHGLTNNEFQPTILRFATVFGLSYRPRFDLVVNLLTAQATVEKQITIMGGDQWRPLVHVRDLVDTIMACLKAPLATVGGQVFNVGSNQENYQIKQVGKIVKEIIPDTEIITKSFDTDVRDYHVSFDKLKQVIDPDKFRSIREGIMEIRDSVLGKNLVVDFRSKRYSNYRNFVE